MASMSLFRPLSVLALLGAGAGVLAQTSPGDQPVPVRPEPQVQRTVVEDDGARIEELRVRGATRSISVSSKLGPRLSYEVVPADAGRNPNPGPSNDRGSTGKAQFPVLQF